MFYSIQIRNRLVGISFLIAGMAVFSIPAQTPPTPTVPIDQLISPTATNFAPLIDFRVLKTLLPETLPGFRRTQISGEKSGILGISIAFAEGLYRNDKTGNLSLKITDMGGMRSIMLMAQAGWATIEIDRETETGYERTTSFGGFKGHEEYDQALRRGEIRILLGTRFLVEITGSDVTPEIIQSAAKTIDYAQLAGLVPNLVPPSNPATPLATNNLPSHLEVPPLSDPVFTHSSSTSIPAVVIESLPAQSETNSPAALPEPAPTE